MYCEKCGKIKKETNEFGYEVGSKTWSNIKTAHTQFSNLMTKLGGYNLVADLKAMGNAINLDFRMLESYLKTVNISKASQDEQRDFRNDQKNRMRTNISQIRVPLQKIRLDVKDAFNTFKKEIYHVPNVFSNEMAIKYYIELLQNLDILIRKLENYTL